MEKKNIKTRFLAGALSIMLSGMPATSGFALENTSGYENQKITLSVVEESLSRCGNLDEEYVAYLRENNIEIIDGNIQVETVEQFKAIKDYYMDYFTDNDFFEATRAYLYFSNMDKYISTNMFYLNYDELNDDLKKRLISEDIVTIGEEFYDMCYLFGYKNITLNEERMLEGDNNHISSKNIIFSKDARTIQSMFEEDLKEAANIIKNEEYADLNKLGDKYLGYLSDDGTYYQPSFSQLPLNKKQFIGENIICFLVMLKRNQYKFLYFFYELSNECDKYFSEIDNVKTKTLKLMEK